MRICILGATGLVGRESLHLVRRAWPDAELTLLASRDQHLDLGDETLPVRAATCLEDAGAPRGELALVALDDDHSRRYVPRLLELGYRVVDKSNTYRLDPGVVLGVAGVNCGLVTDDVRLVANPNCTTIPLTLALAPLAGRHGLRQVAVSTYQAISGAGQAALDRFLTGVRDGHAEPRRLPTHLAPADYPGNVLPHNGKTDASGFSAEERKLQLESKKILARPELATSAQCCRVPVAVGHYLNVWATFDEPLPPSRAEAALGDAPFIRLLPGPAGEGISALATVHDRDRARVGRIRPDPRDPEGRTLCLTVTADNLRLGAATNAVRLATRWFPGRDPELAAPGHMP